jgi:hypothetical protein
VSPEEPDLWTPPVAGAHVGRMIKSCGCPFEPLWSGK